MCLAFSGVRCVEYFVKLGLHVENECVGWLE